MNRRQALIAVAAAGAGLATRRVAQAAAVAYKDQPRTRVSFAVPPGACDTHLMTYGNAKQFPFADPGQNNPAPASPDEAGAVLRFLGIQRSVIVSPSPTAATTARFSRR